MAANSVGLAWAKVHAALLTHAYGSHNFNLLHHSKALGKYFNTCLISVGTEGLAFCKCHYLGQGDYVNGCYQLGC